MSFRVRNLRLFSLVLVSLAASSAAAEHGLVGHWKLAGDAKDSSGGGLHATNHNVDLKTGEFNGRDAYLEVPDASALNFGKGDFSIALQVSTDENLTDVIGDLVSKFDPAARRGFMFTVKSNTSGYNGPCNTRPLFFGVDSGTTGKWADCGRPGGVTHNSDALTVFNGELYAGTVDAPNEADWQHVYRYRGGQNWEDCGRVGDKKVPGVYAMVVHQGELYAATAGSHGGDNTNKGDFARVYRYLGGMKWEDIGQPGENYRVNSLATLNGKLYAASIHTGGQSGGVYVYNGNKGWTLHGKSPGRIHCMTVHDGKLYGAYPRGEVFVFDGNEWKSLGNPYGSTAECNQLHTMGVYQGELYVGTWRNGRVAVWRDGKWVDTGRLGDSTEIVGLIVYNGSFYGGAIPRAELFRYDGPQHWLSLRRLFDPSDYDAEKHVEDWSRASSLTVFQDKMYVTTADCYRAVLSKTKPDEIRGKVYSFKVGEGVSYDRDIGPGWKHVAAVRDGDAMKIYVDGKLAATQATAEKLDASNHVPLRIGFGPQSYFSGKLRDVRLYNRAINESEVKQLQKQVVTATAGLQ
jgi:hypothetical protein